MIPVLSPSGVQEVIDFGLHGWAMSRYSGCWVSIKAISDTIESSAVVDISPERFNFVIPQDFPIPEGGLSIRWPDPPLVQENACCTTACTPRWLMPAPTSSTTSRWIRPSRAWASSPVARVIWT
jgi:TPP-dependent indolepyruvate ferredoxin oxidoreductase alpha subunit